MKRILSMLLALVLLITCVPALPAYATEAEEIHEEVFLEETEPAVTEETEPPTTEETEPPVTEETEPPVTEETEPPVTEETEPPTTEETEPPTTEETEPPMTEETEPPVTEETEPPVTEETELPVVEENVSDEATLTSSAVPEGLEYTVVDDQTVTIVKYTGNAEEVIIPETIEGKPVTVIKSWAFGSCEELKKVVIPNQVTIIENSAFSECFGLEEILIGERVEKIERRAFDRCTSLKKVILPDSLKTMENEVFYCCGSLEYVVLGEGIAVIPYGTFYGCDALKYIVIGKSVERITRSALTGCRSFWHIFYTGTEEQWNAIEIEENEELLSVTRHCNTDASTVQHLNTIACTQKALYKCTACDEILYDKTFDGLHSFAEGVCTVCGVSEIGQENIQDGLRYRVGETAITITGYSGTATELVIPAEINGKPVTEIAPGAFKKNKSLAVTLPGSIKNITSQTFKDNHGLTEVIIQEGTENIGAEAFSNCTNLKRVTLPASLKTMEKDAFSSCQSLNSVDVADLDTWIRLMETNGGMFFSGGWYYKEGYLYINGELLTELVIPTGIKSISPKLFYNCATITSVVIPEGVTVIGDSAFNSCSALRSIVLPESLTNIGASAFNSCEKLTSITIPKNVTSIGEWAFHLCSSLQDVYLPSLDTWLAVKLEDMYSSPLVANSNAKKVYLDGMLLAEVVIPDTITSIPDYAFYTCSDLAVLTIPETVTAIGSNAFKNCTKLKTIQIPDSVTSLGAAAFSGCSGAETLTISKELKKIPNSAFAYCSSLTVVDLPKGIQEIGDSVFYECANLNEITIPEGVTSIGQSVFYRCKSLKSITIPDSLKKVGRSAFDGCTNITEIYVNDIATWVSIKWDSGTSLMTANNLDKNLFVQGEPVVDVVIPDGITHMPSNSFAHVKSLESIYIPDSVGTMGEYTFSNCSNLKWVSVGHGIDKIWKGTFYGCSSLESLFLPDSLADVYTYAFSGCNKLDCIVYGGTAKQLQKITVFSSGNTVLFEAGWHCEGSCCQTKVTVTLDPETRRPVLTWQAAPCVAGWAIYRSTSSKKGYELVDVVYDTMYTDMSDAGGKKYYYIVGGISLMGVVGSASDYKAVSIPCAPPVLTASTDSSGYPYIKWSKVKGAEKYEVYYSATVDGTYTKLATTSKTSYTHTKASAGKGYYYKVKTIGSSSSLNSILSEPVYAVRKLAKPALSVSVTSAGKPTITWKKISGAVEYELQVKCNDGEYQTLTTTTALTFTHEDVAVGNAYTYRARAISAVEETTGDYGSAQTVNIKCGKPVMTLSNDPVTGKPIISWDAVEGAQQYQIYYATSKKGKFKKLTTVEDITFTHTGASASKTYYYKVRALDANGVAGPYCSVKSIVCDCVAPKITSAKSDSKGYPYIKWGKVSGAKKYEIYYSTSQDGTYTKLTTTSKTSYTHTKASAGNGYYYKVRAYGSSTSSRGAFSETVFAARQISKPSVTISLNSTTKEAVIRWKTVKKAIGYEVQVKLNNGEYQTLATTDQLSFTHTGLEVGADYTYRVKAICELEAASRMSSTQTVHIKCAKPAIKVTNDPATGEPSITWDAVEGADYYQVYYATSKKGKYKKLASVSDPAYTHTKASVGKKYYYKVRAVDALGVKSSYSSVKYTVCDCARPVVTVSLNEAGQPVVKWNKVSKAKKYEVYVATAPDGTYTKLKTTTSATYTYTNAEEGITYYYMVRALASSKSANSAYSEPVTLPVA